MSQYGSTGNLSNFRDRTASPAAYSSLGKHRDDYNRYETTRHASAHSRNKSPFEESRFGGFGDRPGSGVELTNHTWQGGEILTDPNQLPKGVKPRRFYYSPIGDGTVAADGYELKRRPVDLSPRVTITQLQHVERGEKGRDGVNVYEKSWTNAAGGPGGELGHGDRSAPDSGANSRAGAMSPHTGGLGGRGGPQGNGLGGLGGPPSDLGTGRPSGAGDPYGGYGNKDPFGTLDSRTGPPYGSNGNLGPQDGRQSAMSSTFSDPAYRLDTKTGYLITNPRELIHQYATTTPVAIMEATDNTPSTTTVSKHSYYKRTEETTEERYAPYAPYKSAAPVASPNKFVRQLRDETMTHSQREANTHSDPVNQRDPNAGERVSQIRSRTSYQTRGNDEIDNLTQQLVSGLQTGTPVPSRF